MSGARYLFERDGVYYYRRRVPSDVAHLDTRRFVRRSTKTRDCAKAIVIADRINRETEDFWETLVDGVTLESSIESFDAAVKRARSLGLRYKSAADLKDAPVDNLSERLAALEKAGLIESKPAAQAAFGTIEKPTVKLSGLVDTFLSIAADRLLDKAPDQVRKYTLPRKRAVNNLVKVIGDKPIEEITRDDALAFREWWLARVQSDGIEVETANKDIGHLNGMINELDDRYRLGLSRVFERMRLRGTKKSQVPAFPSAWVQDRLLAPNALATLNLEGRVVIYIMCNTGMRPSEIVNLSASRIRLEAQVPYVEIAAEGRQTKTAQSEREIPLVGVSLKAARLVPNGFTRYRANADSLSAAVNKYLDENGLKPTPRHTLYSLRHTFQDRLIEVEAPERL